MYYGGYTMVERRRRLGDADYYFLYTDANTFCDLCKKEIKKDEPVCENPLNVDWAYNHVDCQIKNQEACLESFKDYPDSDFYKQHNKILQNLKKFLNK